MKNRDIIHCSDQSKYNEFAAEILEREFEELLKKQSKVNVALSGGTTPLPILDILRKANLDWSKFVFFIVDERCVPLSDPLSNFSNIQNHFFKYIKAKHHSMIRDGLTIDASIEAFKKELFTEVTVSDNGIPVFDLILLGMGEDGHTASLFPETKALDEEKEVVVKNYVPQLDLDRITMTFPVLKNANKIIVLAKGSKKVAVIDEIYNKKAVQYPIYELIDADINLEWIITE